MLGFITSISFKTIKKKLPNNSKYLCRTMQAVIDRRKNWEKKLEGLSNQETENILGRLIPRHFKKDKEDTKLNMIR